MMCWDHLAGAAEREGRLCAEVVKGRRSAKGSLSGNEGQQAQKVCHQDHLVGRPDAEGASNVLRCNLKGSGA
jgi:hypothetical protein